MLGRSAKNMKILTCTIAILCQFTLSADDKTEVIKRANQIEKLQQTKKWDQLYDTYSAKMKEHVIKNIWWNLIHIAEKYPEETDAIIKRHFQEDKAKKMMEVKASPDLIEREQIILENIIHRKELFAAFMNLAMKEKVMPKAVDYSNANVVIQKLIAKMSLGDITLYYIKEEGTWMSTSKHAEPDILDKEEMIRVAPLKIKPQPLRPPSPTVGVGYARTFY
jgi:predicted small metal-binding protein